MSRRPGTKLRQETQAYEPQACKAQKLDTYDLPCLQWQQAEVVDKTLLSELLQERAIHAMPPLTRNWRKP